MYISSYLSSVAFCLGSKRIYSYWAPSIHMLSPTLSFEPQTPPPTALVIVPSHLETIAHPAFQPHLTKSRKVMEPSLPNHTCRHVDSPPWRHSRRTSYGSIVPPPLYHLNLALRSPTPQQQAKFRDEKRSQQFGGAQFEVAKTMEEGRLTEKPESVVTSKLHQRCLCLLTQ